ncbi:hypothetical protein GCM10009835_22730 [Planosporangium flavigriseum]|uniref:Uncharacterized protein n=1 Tax=Planosporangium flavigriseum TaxID=373681 RepID=A0A8J3PMU8_9ACTN|nr:hypothetical protein Pfl04_43350 [Planosporangium flavigriseum]
MKRHHEPQGAQSTPDRTTTPKIAAASLRSRVHRSLRLLETPCYYVSATLDGICPKFPRVGFEDMDASADHHRDPR